MTSAPVDIGLLAKKAGAELHFINDMEPDESGRTFPLKGKQHIWINNDHSHQRKRFTALHEIGHIVLGLPSIHHSNSGDGYYGHGTRAPEEVACDAFAAECLLPYTLIIQDLKGEEVSLSLAKTLADQYQASLGATMSRMAVNCEVSCAFALTREGQIHYVASSKYLREMGGWIDLGVPAPRDSVTARVQNSLDETEAYDEVPTTVWFRNGIQGYELVVEEAIHRPRYNECLSLIWIDETLRRDNAPAFRAEDESPLLEELDGQLPWPGKSRRR